MEGIDSLMHRDSLPLSQCRKVNNWNLEFNGLTLILEALANSMTVTQVLLENALERPNM